MEVTLKQPVNSSTSTQILLSVVTNGSIQYKILLTLGIPSFICYIFLIIYMFTQKSHRKAPHNYCTLIILNFQFFCNVVDIPSQIYYYRNLQVMFASAFYCYAWQYIPYSIWPISLMLLAWASFERHILIFHDHLLHSQWKTIYLHYAPPIIIISYVTCFYIYAYAYYTCTTPYQFYLNHCGNSCYSSNIVMLVWIRVAHYMLPSFLTAICSISLLIRVICSKHRHQQIFVWRKHKKMAYQLLSLAVLSAATVFPYSIVRFTGLVAPNLISKPVQDMFSFSSLLEPLYFPFVHLVSTAEIWITIRRKLRRLKARQTAPMNSNHA